MIDYEEHLYWDTPQLVIAFAGGPQNVYQFGKSLTKLQVDHVLIRDSRQMYCYYGVIGIGNRSAVANFIDNYYYHPQHYDKIITTGVSSGGYPALYYGQIVAVDKVVVFSAITGRQADDFSEEDRWRILDSSCPKDLDLRQYFINGPIPEVQAFIGDAEDTKLDRQMVERIGITDIAVVANCSHADVARRLRDEGKFKELFT